MESALRSLLVRARDAYESGDFDQAEPLLREASEKGSFADVYNMLGVIHHRRGRYDAAGNAFEEALRLNPAYTEAALNLAVTYNELGRYAEAKKIYEEALGRSKAAPDQLDPFVRGKIANLHGALGDAYASAGLLDEAVRQYRGALDLAPTFADIRTRLGSCLRDLGRLEDAVIEFGRVRSHHAAYVPARLHLGLTLYALGHKQEAEREWEEALKIDPDNRSARTYLQMARRGS